MIIYKCYGAVSSAIYALLGKKLASIHAHAYFLERHEI